MASHLHNALMAASWRLQELAEHNATKDLMSHVARPQTQFEDCADLATELGKALDPVFLSLARAAELTGGSLDGGDAEYRSIVTSALCDLLFDCKQKADAWRKEERAA